MKRCRVCQHPEDWHGDRAIAPCIHLDEKPDPLYGQLAYPKCRKNCLGYEADLPHLYLTVLAQTHHFVTIAAVPLAV